MRRDGTYTSARSHDRFLLRSGMSLSVEMSYVRFHIDLLRYAGIMPQNANPRRGPSDRTHPPKFLYLAHPKDPFSR